jgi:urease subunit gamma/beta
VHLTPREEERLLLAAAADLARRRLARGAPLGATEAVALVCDEICEMAWDGVPLAEVITRARSVVAPSSLLPGAASLVPVIEVEALFPWGSTLVHVDAPFGSPDYPERTGATLPAPGSIELAAGLPRRTVTLRNTGPRDVWVSSHFPLDQVNPAVSVSGEPPGGDGDRGRGAPDAGTEPPMPGETVARSRLDLPAGEALLLRAGEERQATVVVVATEPS